MSYAQVQTTISTMHNNNNNTKMFYGVSDKTSDLSHN